VFYQADPASEGLETSFSVAAFATDLDLPAESLIYSLEDVPREMYQVAASGHEPQIDGNGYFRWTPSEVHGGKSYEFDVRITDVGGCTAVDEDGESALRKVSIAVNEVNSPPEIEPISDFSVDTAHDASFKVYAVDPDDPEGPLSFALEFEQGASIWYSVEIDSTGCFRWRPSVYDPGPGDYPITVIVTDEGQASSTSSFMLHVEEGAGTPDMVDYLAIGSDYQSVSFSSENDPEQYVDFSLPTELNWSLFSPTEEVTLVPQHPLPTGKVALLNSSTVRCTVAPADVGAYSFFVRGQDGTAEAVVKLYLRVDVDQQESVVARDVFAVVTPDSENTAVYYTPGTADVVSNPSHGNVTSTTPGVFNYTPDSGYRGLDTFTYMLTNDQDQTSNTGLVVLWVGEYYEFPVAVDFVLQSGSSVMPLNTGLEEGAVHNGIPWLDHEENGIAAGDPDLFGATLTLHNTMPVNHYGAWSIDIPPGVRVYRIAGENDIEEIVDWQKYSVATPIPAGGSHAINFILEGAAVVPQTLTAYYYPAAKLPSGDANAHFYRYLAEISDSGSYIIDGVSVNTSLTVHDVTLTVEPATGAGFLTGLERETTVAVVPPVADGADLAAKLDFSGLVGQKEVTFDVPEYLQLRHGTEVFTHGSQNSIRTNASHILFQIEGVGLNSTLAPLVANVTLVDDEGDPLHTPPVTFTDSFRVGVASVDLTVATLTDEQEDTYCAYVPLNNNFDENNAHPVPGCEDPVTDNSCSRGLDVSVVPGIHTADGDLVTADVTIDLLDGMAGEYWIELEATSDPSRQLRIWNADGTPAPVGRESAVAITADATFPLLIEGLQATRELITMTARFAPAGNAHFEGSILDEAAIRVVSVDLDIDSDNDGAILWPDDYWLEETIEADATLPGKYVPVNDGDADGDGLVDFADGFDLDGSGDSADDLASNQFTPLRLELPQLLELDTPQIRFDYSGSDPRNVDPTDGLYTPDLGDPNNPAGLRIWTKSGSTARLKTPVDEGGSYVAPDQPYTVALFAPVEGKIPFYVEGISEGEFEIRAEVDPDGPGPAGFVAADTVRVTVVGADLDVDSDNNGTIDLTEYNLEDQTEAAPDAFGKVVPVNTGDADSDFVPDFADGIDRFGNDQAVAGTGFIPVHFAIPTSVDPQTATFRFDYSASDPAGVTFDPTESTYGLPTTGHLRLWNVPGNQSRQVADVRAGGNFVAPLNEYRTSHFPAAGTLYLEAVSASTAPLDVAFEVDPDGPLGPADYMVTDTVVVSTVEIDLRIDSDNTAGLQQSAAEDQREYYDFDPESESAPAGFLGKVIPVNDGDADVDGIPDFADGFDTDGNGQADADASEKFVPVVVAFVGPAALFSADDTKIYFSYSGSDPSGVTRESHQENEPYDPTYAPAAGHLRLWDQDGDVARSAEDLTTESGNYLDPSVVYTREQLPGTFYLEGVHRSSGFADQAIRVYLDLHGGEVPDYQGALLMDAVNVTVLQVDLDVDTDNDAATEREVFEDQFEAMHDTPDNEVSPNSFPGKVVYVNTGDEDDDGIPDFADFHGDDGHGASAGFTPITLEIPEPIDTDAATIRFDYNSSTPAYVEQQPVVQRLHYVPTLGNLRLWNVDGANDRDPRVASTPEGNYVAPGYRFTFSDLLSSSREVTVYAEGIHPSHQWADDEIIAYVDPDGPDGVLDELVLDRVRLTVVAGEVSVVAANAYAAEPLEEGGDVDDPGAFLISRGEGNVYGELAVSFRLIEDGDAAASETDFQLSTSPGSYLLPDLSDPDAFTVTIPEGYSNVTLTVTPKHDVEVEWNEVVELSLERDDSEVSDSGGVDPPVALRYQVNNEADSAQITILDNDGASAAVSQNADIVSTGESPAVKSDGVVTAGIQEGDVTLVPTLGTSAFSPAYVGNDGAYPIVVVDAQFPGPPPSDLRAEFRFADLDVQTVHYDLSDFVEQKDLRFAFQADATGLPSGHYDYDVTFIATVDGKEYPRTFRGSTEVFNRLDDDAGQNHFGSGWWVPGLDQIVMSDGLPFDQSNPPASADDETTYRLARQGASTENGAALIRSDNSAGWFSSPWDTAGVAAIFDDETDTNDLSYAESDEPDNSPWMIGTYEGGFQGDYRCTDSQDATATWTIPGLQQGQIYQLFTTWTPAADRDPAAKYRVTGGTRIGAPDDQTPWDVVVDQRFSPGEIGPYSHPWRSLGFFSVSGDDDLTITLSGSNTGFLVADAVLVVGHWEFDTPEGSFCQLQHDAGSFTLRDKFGTNYIFNRDGWMTDVYDRFDNHTLLEYDAQETDRLDKITTQSGLTTQFDYDGSGKLDQVTDFAGRKTAYQWGGDSLTVTLPDPGEGQPGPVQWQFQYNAHHLLESITDPEENQTEIEYEASRLARVTNAKGTEDQATWKLRPMNVVALTENTGAPDDKRPLLLATDVEATYTDAVAVAAGADYAWTYQTDRYGYITSETKPDAGSGERTWEWERTVYDQNPDIWFVNYIEPPGGGGCETLGEVVTLYEYKRGNLVSIEYDDDVGKIENWEYDTNFSQVEKYQLKDGGGAVYGHYVQYELDSRGRAKTKKEKVGETVLRTTKYQYTPAPAQIGDVPGGLITSTTYALDTPDEVTDVTEYYDVPGKIGLVKQVGYAVGTPVAGWIKYDYDAHRNLYSTRDECNRETLTVYDALDRLVCVQQPATTDYVLPITRYLYDRAGNNTAVIDARANAADGLYMTDYEYDAMNRLEFVRLPAPGDGNEHTDQTRPETQYVYDANGNLKEERVLTAEGKQRITAHDYDERNQLIKTTYADPDYSAETAGIFDTAQSVRPIVHYAYDALGNVKWETDPRFGLDPDTLVRTEYVYDDRRGYHHHLPVRRSPAAALRIPAGRRLRQSTDRRIRL